MNKAFESAAAVCRALALCGAIAALALWIPFSVALSPVQQSQQASASSLRIGTIKAINGTAIKLAQDSGPDVSITLQPSTRIVRIAPGEKDLKNATPIQFQDLQIGDRILVGGKPSDDNSSLVASSVVVMKRSDLEARHQQDLQDWQKRGVGGLVSTVDASAGTVTISVVSFSGKKDLIVRTSKSTVIRRYAPDSVKFDDAKPGTLHEIHPGDQLRARGDRNADGTELTADEIVSGTFRNVAGTVNSVDPGASTLSVQDLLSKKSVVVKVTADSRLRQLPPEMAQLIAMRLKGTVAGVAVSGATPNSSADQTAGSSQPEPVPKGADEGVTPRSGGTGGRSSGTPDLQQLLSRMPAASLADLHQGDAVMLVSTEGAGGTGTAIQLLIGVEPILQASASAGQAIMLAPWSLSAPAGDLGGP